MNLFGDGFCVLIQAMQTFFTESNPITVSYFAGINSAPSFVKPHLPFTFKGEICPTATSEAKNVMIMFTILFKLIYWLNK